MNKHCRVSVAFLLLTSFNAVAGADHLWKFDTHG